MIINLTPHVLTLLDATRCTRGKQGYTLPDGTAAADVTLLSIAPTAPEARAAQSPEVAGEPIDHEGITVPTVAPIVFGAPTGLPEPREGVYLAVSALTANAAKAHGRTTSDLLVPTNVVRDAGGKPVGCTAFARV